MLRHPCHVCGAPAVHTCRFCGRLVCGAHHDEGKGICTSCAAGTKG